MAQQKIRKRIISLLALSAVVLVFAVMQLSLKIKRPLHPKGVDSDNLIANQHILDRTLDTDGDGIPDIDEITIYGTSPYLVDTDGDGISDYDEIFVYGTDPLCPEGEVCFMSDYYSDNSQEALMPDINNLENLDINDLDPATQAYLLQLLLEQEALSIDDISDNSDINITEQVEDNEEDSFLIDNIDEVVLEAVLSGEVDTNTLRLLLLEGGMDADALARVNDQELIKIYQEMLNQE